MFSDAYNSWDSDNILVARNKHFATFFQAYWRRSRIPAQGKEPAKNESVVLIGVYTVPGRVDSYKFSMDGKEDKLRYFSDGGMPVDKAVALFKKHIARKECQLVVETAMKDASPAMIHGMRILLASIAKDKNVAKVIKKLEAMRAAKLSERVDKEIVAGTLNKADRSKLLAMHGIRGR